MSVMNPNNPALAQALALHQAGRFAEAEPVYREGLRRDPNNAEGLKQYGVLLRQLGKWEESIALLSKAAQVHPGDGALVGELGVTLYEYRRFDEAAACFRKLVALKPRSTMAHLYLGRALMAMMDSDRAITVLHKALELSPRNPDVEALLASAYVTQGQPERSIGYFRSALATRPDAPDAKHLLVALAHALMLCNRFDEALATFRRAQELFPGFLTAVAGEAETYESMREYERAADVIRPHVKDGVPPTELALVWSRCLARQGQREQAVPVLRGALAREDLAVHYRSLLTFELGATLEALERYDEAFAAFAQANALYPKTFSRAAHARLVDALMAVFSKESIGALPRSADRTDLPVFIVGMPRSGTSLLEQILGCHPMVHAAGELPDMNNLAIALPEKLGSRAPYPDCLRSLTGAQAGALAASHLAMLRALGPGKARVTDKMPHNFIHLGLIALLFPGCRVLHATRHPMDNCLSCFTTRLSPVHSYSNDLEDLGVAYGQYRRLMAHWKGVLDIPMMDVAYEDMVRDQEGTTRRVLEFLGLPWDDACLRFHEAERVVRTASREQVRQKVYTSSVEKWRRYEKHLGPLKAALAPWL